ncbi:MAG: DUF2938 family protein [Pseudomonadota bacterium]|mgnify:CR=1 FL=1|uniref:DUF2938 family protein n=1 Tax=Phenylobacterium sp. TaxID=1871053 RepID=UPI0025E142A4|nr:DUF2938 family protein [Phenylobacterium sp.]MBT9473889.1 DUF2938 family protein [Phenylobacterium sp.]
MIVRGVIVGLFGVLVFDLWNILAQRAFAIRAPNWAILGKWLLAPFGGDRTPITPATVFSPAQRYLGAVVHYATGGAFGLALVLAMGPAWSAQPTVLPAVAAGVLTTLLAWFIIMPALGHGVAAAKLPVRHKVRASTLVAHTVMGLGFYLGAVVVQGGLGR